MTAELRYPDAVRKKAGRKVSVSKFPWVASSRAIANGAEYGFTKLVWDEDTHRVIGGGIVGPRGGEHDRGGGPGH